MIIGLTGPIGSGKTEAVKIFRKHDFHIIEADSIGHEILSLPDVIKKLTACFGKDILQNGKIDRKKLRKTSFSSRKNLKRLDSITHPEIKKAIKVKLNKLSKRKKVIIDAALLERIGLLPLVDMVVFVRSSKKKRFSRLVGSRKIKAVEIKACMRLQPSDKEYQKVSDIVISNEGNIIDFRRAVREIVGYLICHI
jgi:dephospho-CoA kinase